MVLAPLVAVMQTGEIDELVGQVVEERYRIEAALGSGGMGSVYRARHIRVGREVAIKVLHDHLVRDPVMVERFEREAAIAAKLDHKNLISVIDFGETAGKQKLMVLELARGQNLAELVAQGPIEPARVMYLTAQILAGLEHAHAAGLVHRDLKPENIIVTIDDSGADVPKIVDFGIAVLRDGSDGRRLTAVGTVLGTPAYMAPEHAKGFEVDARSDLFALGVIVFELLAGKLPFDGSGVEVALANITKDPPRIAERSNVQVGPLLEAFMRRLMARQQSDRFQSARAALDVLELIDSHPDVATDILLPRPPRLPSHAPMAMAATLEAPRAVQKRPKPNRPWRPWRELGVVVGIALAALALAVRPAPQQQQPAVELELALPAQQVVVTAVSMDGVTTEALH
jgi:eukaryotic-like serine/threonine-protein kinase